MLAQCKKKKSYFYRLIPSQFENTYRLPLQFFLKIFFLFGPLLKSIKFVTVLLVFLFFGCKSRGILTPQPTPPALEGEVLT